MHPTSPDHRLTVGVDCRSLEQRRTGIGRYLENQLAQLAALCPHWDLVLYTLGPPPDDARLAHSPFRWRQVGFECVRQQHMFAAEWERDPPDVFFSPLYELPDPIDLPCVCTVHDLVHEATPEAFTPFQLAYLQSAHQHTFRTATHILTVSEFARGEMIKRGYVGADRVTVAHNAADPRFCITEDPTVQIAGRHQLASQLGVEPPYLLYVGAVSAKRHVLETVHAFLRSTALPSRECASSWSVRTTCWSPLRWRRQQQLLHRAYSASPT